MFEKVNPCHPDKVADRIAGAVVDLAYKAEPNPKIAVEVLIGHGKCHIIAETSVYIGKAAVKEAVKRIAGSIEVDYVEVPQDKHSPITKSEKCAAATTAFSKAFRLPKSRKNSQSWRVRSTPLILRTGNIFWTVRDLSSVRVRQRV